MTQIPIPASLPLKPFLKALGNPLRWRLLTELSAGEPLMVNELSKLLKRPVSAISKHLGIMRAGGVVEIGRGHLYQIPAAYRVSPGQVDFGHCLLRLREGVDGSALAQEVG